MQRLRQWANDHASLVLLLVLIALTASGLAIYCYARTREPPPAKNPLIKCAVGSVAECKLREVGQMGLAWDKVRQHLQTRYGEKATIELQGMNAEPEGIGVKVKVKGKEKQFLVRPDGQIVELP